MGDVYYNPETDISIHAAREGGYVLPFGHTDGVAVISIHAAREGGDTSTNSSIGANCPFQSTPPVKAATLRDLRIPETHRHFNPRRP